MLEEGRLGAIAKSCLSLSSEITGAPFLKWAGGKTQLLSQFEKFLPGKIAGYAEPFIGSGALFFYLRRTRGDFRAVLADSNPDLINAYIVVRDKVDKLLTLLAWHQRSHNREHYYRVRQEKPVDLDDVERAARLIYLNKTCFNGLYRVNSEGVFNVPMGSYASPRIFDRGDLSDASLALQGAKILRCDFAEIEDHISEGDFVYFDPPYHPVSKTSNFTGYTVRSSSNRMRRNRFGIDEQQRLAATFARLDARGCQVMLSNSDARIIHSYYEGFRIERVTARRAINCDGAKRGLIHEVVVLNF